MVSSNLRKLLSVHVVVKKIDIDRRWTLSELKTHIGRLLDMPTSTFVVYSEYAAGQMMEFDKANIALR
jgi:hypothetical protein